LKRILHTLIAGVIAYFALAAFPASYALADVAPPSYPPGADIQNGGTTQVSMMSEAVTITIRADKSSAEGQFGALASTEMSGDVDANFVMYNPGSADESMDVRFPLGAPTGMGDVGQVENFAATVNDVPATITTVMEPGEFDTQVPWATWPVTFAAGQNTTIHVTYKVRPTGYSPYGRFNYILETGAGWNGPIGQGTITMRLPYHVNAQNTDLGTNPASFDAPNPQGFTVNGTDVVWSFTNLEPTSENNIKLTVLQPDIWQAIVKSRLYVMAKPDSAEAWSALAKALYAGLAFKHTLLEIAQTGVLAGEAQAAYEKALQLDPNNVQTIVDYARFLLTISPPFEPPSPRFKQLVAQGLQLDPNNEDLKFWQSNLIDNAPPADPSFPTSTPLPTPAPYTQEPAVEPTQVAQVTSAPATEFPPVSTSTYLPPGDTYIPTNACCPNAGLIILLVVGMVIGKHKSVR